MRVFHLVFGYLPDPPGGTELYVQTLCRHLPAKGFDSVVAAPGPRDDTYEVEGVRVRRFAVAPMRLRDLYAGSRSAATSIGRLLDEEQPHVVHQHALTPACPGDVGQQTKRRGLPLVFTYHTPTVSCQRGTLLEHGRAVCDGRLDVTRCTACTLDGLGTGERLGRILAAAPVSGGRLLERVGREGGVWTALRMTSLIRQRHAALDRFFRDVDRFVALAPWVADVLRNNGVPDDKICLVPHGVERPAAVAGRPSRRSGSSLRLVHLGRVDPVKGTMLLVEAFRALPSTAPIELDIYGIAQESSGVHLLEEWRAAIANDSRVRLMPPLPHEAVIDVLSHYDVLVAPSQWMETGPLVVLEAFAAGVPVLASDLGGLADKVRHGVDGVLVRPFNDRAAWTAALRSLADDPALAVRFRSSVQAPRSAAEVADDMARLYCGLSGSAPASFLPQLAVS